MGTFSNRFNFHETKYEIDMNSNPNNNGYWEKAKAIKIGRYDEPKVTIQGQHHNYNLYLSFHIDDNSLRDGKDMLTICFDAKTNGESDTGHVLLRYDFTFVENECKSFYSESYDNANNWIFISSPAPSYIQGKIYKDERLCYWDAVIKIRFDFLKEIWNINPGSFGIYIQVLDYIDRFKFTRYNLPEITGEDTQNPGFIPPSDKWAIGCLAKLPAARRKPLWLIDKYFNNRKVA